MCDVSRIVASFVECLSAYCTMFVAGITSGNTVCITAALRCDTLVLICLAWLIKSLNVFRRQISAETILFSQGSKLCEV